MTRRGRPPLVADEAILECALAAFASSGFEAMSVRALNAELGLSHETISKRFGPKIELFRAAVRFGIGRFVEDLDRANDAPDSEDDLEQLRGILRAFMVTTELHPTLGELLHHKGLDDAERAILLDDTGLGERLQGVADLLDRLHRAGRIRPMRLRDVWFLAQGAMGPLRFPSLARMFDPFDGPLDRSVLVEEMTDAVMRSMVLEDSGR